MLYVIYGVKAESLDEVNDLVQKATGEISIGRENDCYGDYFRFGKFQGENIVVIFNEDMYDGEPVFLEAVGWKYVVILEESNPESQYFAALESAPTTFVKLKSETYGP
jgi:hypothetical protein